MRGHLRGVRLHGVVKHEKAEPGQQARRKRRPPVRGVGQHQGAHAHNGPADQHQPLLAEAADQVAADGHVEHAAQPEQRHDGARHRQRQAERAVQVRCPDGQHAETGRAFDQRHQQDDARPGAGDDEQGLPGKPMAHHRLAVSHGLRGLGLLPAQVTIHQRADHAEQQRHEDKRPAPAQRIGQQAAGQLAADDAQRAAQPGAGQHFLELVGRHRVAHPGHRQRNQGCRAQRHQQARKHQRFKRAGEHGQNAADAAAQRGEGDNAELAQPVAERAVKQLRRAVGDGKHRHHLRGLRQADREHARQLGQHGVADALRRHAGEGAKRQQQNGTARGRADGRSGNRRSAG
ncbi:hypothetical protein POHY109586_13920 [Polaromonas hydrogenivorans]